MSRLSLLLALFLSLAMVPTAAAAQGDRSGLYAPFPEPAQGASLGPLGLAGAPPSGDRTRPLRAAVGAGPASVRAGAARGLPSPLPPAGLLLPLLVMVAVGGHVWSRRRRAGAG